MMIKNTGLTQLNKVPLKRAGEVLARAFADDPLYSYLVPDENDRMQYLPYVFMSYMMYGLNYGEVYATSSELEGLAFWIPSEFCDFTPERFNMCTADVYLNHIGLKYLERFKINDQVIEVHKELLKEPHLYLMVLGVDPEFQGKGFGKNLLQPMLTHLDGISTKCYLDTNKIKNVPFYQRFGFEVIKEYELGSSGIKNWSMIRNPVSS